MYIDYLFCECILIVHVYNTFVYNKYCLYNTLLYVQLIIDHSILYKKQQQNMNNLIIKTIHQ